MLMMVRSLMNALTTRPRQACGKRCVTLWKEQVPLPDSVTALRHRLSPALFRYGVLRTSSTTKRPIPSRGCVGVAVAVAEADPAGSLTSEKGEVMEMDLACLAKDVAARAAANANIGGDGEGGGVCRYDSSRNEGGFLLLLLLVQ
eukprot:Rhum_TRINITY_DN14427_c3_g2::Rhum_TRINITY_DN14427_c3_g2_i1::g.89788::m.89788